MMLSPIPDLSLVLPSDAEEWCRGSLTPDVACDLEGAFNVPGPSWSLPFPIVPPDTDTAFRFQTDFLGLGDDAYNDIITQWICAVQRGSGTPAWRAFVARWQKWMPGGHGRYTLFGFLMQKFRRIDMRLRPAALECFLTDGPDGRAAVQRHWHRVGLGKFSREHWPLVQRLLRRAGMLR